MGVPSSIFSRSGWAQDLGHSMGLHWETEAIEVCRYFFWKPGAMLSARKFFTCASLREAS